MYPVTNLHRVLFANGKSIENGGKFHNIKINLGGYNLSIPIYVIPIGGVDVVLGIQWFRTLGTVSTN